MNVQHRQKSTRKSGEDMPVFDDPAVTGYGAGWSPDGEGKQLVMMRPDGSELLVLTNNPLYDHSHPVWSPDD